MNLNEVLQTKDYKNVLKHFCEISAVPRGSGYNEKISNWLCDFAKANGIVYEQDTALNVILRKPATKGYEKAPRVILQGHMDMVCVKTEDCTHDFLSEGLSLLTDGELIYADRTTLGADDGIAIAYMLSILTDNSLQHPELICLITTDEETGMDGARAVETKKIDAEYLINIDSEEEGVCWCGCAGGQRLELRLPVIREAVEGYAVTIILGGLSGGHSGADIHKYIPNAIHVMGRFLAELAESCNYRIIDMQGGEKDNSVPVNATVSILIQNPAEDGKKIQSILDSLTRLYGRGQEKMKFVTDMNPVQDNASLLQKETSVLQKESQEKLIFLLNQLPDGVQCMSTQIPGLVETSLNLGVFALDQEQAVYHLSLRSSVAYELQALSKKIKTLAKFVGADAESGSDYPAWEYRSESKLRELFCETYSQLFGRIPKTAAIHAGLECGLFSEKLPETDMISIGPDMHDIHTPKERLEISSTVRVYKVLEKMLGLMTE